jgi:hypothetical protein
MFVLAVLAVLGGWLGALPAPSVHAATFTVTSTEDSGPGSLRDAINNAAPGDTINFSVTGTITLTSGSLSINKDLTINGPGASNLTISRNDASYYQPQAFDIWSGNVTISNLTISHASNGAVTNHSATVTLDHCILSSNSGGGLTSASAIFNGKTLVVTNSTLSGNINGNSILSTSGSNVTVTNSTFSDNTSPDYSAGIFSRGTLVVTNSTFTHNTADDGGGIHIGAGTATVINSTFTNNSAIWGYG